MPPWTREPGPLGKAQKEGDAMKKKADQVIKEATKLVNNKKLIDRESQLEKMYITCVETKTLIQNHYDNVGKLKEDDEPSKIKDYEKKRTTELNRMSVVKTQLAETMNKLLPNTSEEEFLRRHNQGKSEGKGTTEKQTKSDEEDEDDEDEDDDDEAEETEDEDDEDKDKSAKEKQSKVLKKGSAVNDEDDDDEEEDEEDEEEDEDDDDSHIQKKDAKDHQVKKTPPADDDDEEEEEEEEEDEEDSEEEEDEDDEDEEEEDQDDTKGTTKKKKDTKLAKKKKDDLEVTQSTHLFVAIQEFDGEQDGDLSFKEGDVLTVIDTREDGWWTAENDKGERGLVPSTFLKVHNPYRNVQLDDEDEEEEEDEEDGAGDSPRKSGRQLWGGIKKAVKETTVSDVLHAMGAVPSGFRTSTLCRMFNEGDTYRMANYLAPKLSQSNLTYRDLLFDPATNRIRPRSTRIEHLITLVSCQQIPPPGTGIEVLDHHVRICLFDGQRILSNIHCVKVASVDKSGRTWTFTTRVHDLMNPHMQGEFFVRTNNTLDNIGVLFELCISYKRTSTQERGEFSCGWVNLPLLENGMVITNKSFDLYVHGGTFYEKGVEVDPNISRRTTSNALVSLISGNKQPRLIVKVQTPRQLHKELMNTLPDTFVGNTCLLRLYSYYRQCLADVLLKDRLDLTSAELIHDPLLKGFPHAADTPDLMELFTHEWIKKLREVKHDEKLLEPTPLKDEEYMKELFRKVFMECVYPVSHLAMVPEYKMGDTEVEKLRRESATKFAELKNQGKTPLSALLSADLVFKPFKMSEVSFDIIGPYSLVAESS
ncbi:hypothetical protein BsWGS_10812 [Bradybaena similaris]